MSTLSQPVLVNGSFEGPWGNWDFILHGEQVGGPLLLLLHHHPNSSVWSQVVVTPIPGSEFARWQKLTPAITPRSLIMNCGYLPCLEDDPYSGFALSGKVLAYAVAVINHTSNLHGLEVVAPVIERFNDSDLHCLDGEGGFVFGSTNRPHGSGRVTPDNWYADAFPDLGSNRELQFRRFLQGRHGGLG